MRCIDRAMTRRFLVSVSVMACALSARAINVSQEAEAMRVAVNDARPLSKAIEVLETRLGVAITYEEAPYHLSQCSRVTNVDRPGQGSGASQRLTFRGGPFSFEYQLLPGAPETQMIDILAALLRQYRSAGHAGNFRLDRTGNMFHVVPATRRADAGVDEPFEAILNTELLFSARASDQSAIDAIENLAGRLRRATGVDVAVGQIPTNLLAQTKVAPSPGNRSARKELARILSGTRLPVSWRLNTGCPDDPRPVLNIHIVLQENSAR